MKPASPRGLALVDAKPSHTRASAALRASLRQRSARGLTLVETVVTLIVVAVLASLAAPSLGGTLTRWRVGSTAQALQADLRLARAQAIMRQTDVVLCRSADSLSCASGSWNRPRTEGWLVFADDNGNAAVDAGEPVIQVQQALPAGVSINSSVSSGRVTFQALGWSTNGARTLTVTGASNRSCLVISRTGRLRASTCA